MHNNKHNTMKGRKTMFNPKKNSLLNAGGYTLKLTEDSHMVNGDLQANARCLQNGKTYTVYWDELDANRETFWFSI